MDGFTFDTREFGEYLAELHQLPRSVRKSLAKGAVATAASVIRKESIRRAPMDTGALRRAIYQVRLNEQCTETAEVWKVDVRTKRITVKARGGGKRALSGAFYAWWIEFGHYARVSSTGRVGGARFKRSERAMLGGAGLVEGAYWVPARPFMRPAFEAKKDEAMRALADYIETNLPVATAVLSYIKPTG